MNTPLIHRPQPAHMCEERGVTMLLVAIAMVAIIAMAALSIDVITLYLAKEEAQRAADAAALAGAQVISLSGLTGDPTNATSNWGAICGTNGSAASVAKAVANQNLVGGIAPTTINVNYSAGSASSSSGTNDCTSLSIAAFGINPVVTVQVIRTGVPNFFSRIWGRRGASVSAIASAEVFNPSNSASVGTSGSIIPVQPRCVKPWVVPNQDPLYPIPNTATGPFCNQTGQPACGPFVNPGTGAIQHSGISTGGTSANGVIGETFWLIADCNHGNPNYCNPLAAPQANSLLGVGFTQNPPNLLGLPGQVGTPVTAIPSCSGGDPYEEAIEGCDVPTNYQCGVPLANAVDLTKHNPGVNSITDAVECLTHQTDATNLTSSSGQDYLNTFAAPAAYPFQILAGGSNPLGATFTGTPITNSNSIVSLPIYDQTAVPNPAGNAVTSVTFVGFLQVFINAVDVNGNRLVTVLNVAGCGNGTNPTGTPVTGSSPVPVRLITPP
jgi:Flp pilus assembly protein TadG